MKAIMLAAWQGTRLRPVTDTIPKVMVQILGKSLLEHNMDRLLPYVDEFIIVVKYMKEMVIDMIGDSYRWIPVRYEVQGDEKWTGAAIKNIDVTGDIIIVYADQIVSQEDIDREMSLPYYAVLVREVGNPEKYGIFTTDDQWFAQELIEKPQSYIWNMANFWFFKVTSELIDMMQDVPLSSRWEIEITDGIRKFMREYPLMCVPLKNEVIDITSVQDLEVFEAS